MQLIEPLFPTLSFLELQKVEPDLRRLPYSQIVRRRMLIGHLNGVAVLIASHACTGQVLDWLQELGANNAPHHHLPPDDSSPDDPTEGDFVDDTSPAVWLVADADFEAFIQRIGSSLRALSPTQETLTENTGDEPIEVLSLAAIAEEKNPVVKLLGSTLFDASRSMASDIHIENHGTGAAIRYRLDGMLIRAFDINGREQVEQLVSRLKVLSGLDVGERRLPQDGRLRVSLDGRQFELRVSILPGIFGEDSVLRLLDRSGLGKAEDALSLEHLGLGKAVIAHIRQLSRRPHGMLLVTGPTGSGKTTTLYGALSEINDSLQKIVTIEDPVEYQLSGVLQIPVNEKTGMSFSRGLRAILRHDPDTILVGEIRDAETAQIAVQAALTGHLVFSSVHANSAVDVIGRLGNMGIDAYNLASALNAVVSQRLLRKVCLRCRQQRSVSPDERILIAQAGNIDSVTFGSGCGECRGTGYKGRIACAEVFELNDDLRDLIINRATPREILKHAATGGMIRIAEQAFDLLVAGLISVEEYSRVASLK